MWYESSHPNFKITALVNKTSECNLCILHRWKNCVELNSTETMKKNNKNKKKNVLYHRQVEKFSDLTHRQMYLLHVVTRIFELICK